MECFGEESFENGAKAIEKCLNDLGLENFQVADGSGLSRGNKYSPHAMVSVLRSVYEHPDRAYFVIE